MYHWAVYIVNANQLFLMSTDTLGTNTPITSGRAISTTTSFSTTSLTNAGGIHCGGERCDAGGIGHGGTQRLNRYQLAECDGHAIHIWLVEQSHGVPEHGGNNIYRSRERAVYFWSWF